VYLFGSALAGIILAIAAWLAWKRYRGPIMIAGLALGAWISGWLVYRVGRDVGRAAADRLSAPTDKSIHFKAPVQLRVQSHGLWHGVVPYTSGVLLTMAITAVATYIVMAGFSNSPHLHTRPDVAPQWYHTLPDAGRDPSSGSAAMIPDHSSTPVSPAPDEAAPPPG
jgi:hypothetical protein